VNEFGSVCGSCDSAGGCASRSKCFACRVMVLLALCTFLAISRVHVSLPFLCHLCYQDLCQSYQCWCYHVICIAW